MTFLKLSFHNVKNSQSNIKTKQNQSLKPICNYKLINTHFNPLYNNYKLKYNKNNKNY